eukprot:gene487-520_t
MFQNLTIQEVVPNLASTLEVNLDRIFDEILQGEELSETSSASSRTSASSSSTPSKDSTRIEAAVEALGRHYFAIPDINFNFSEVKVCQRLDTVGSRVLISSLIKGTLVYGLVPRIEGTASLPVNEEVALVDSKSLYCFDASQQNDNMLLRLLEQQVDYCLQVFLTISLDEQHRFVSVDVEASRA